MNRDDDNQNRLGGGDVFDSDGNHDDREARSVGDEATFAAGMEGNAAQSLGDEVTFAGGSVSGDDFYDDSMEIVDLDARYKTEGTLGKGGMGEVSLATDTRLERKVAIKRLHGAAAKSRTAVIRFLTEAKSVAALNHPNIVQIFDYGRAEDGPFLIMEFVEGNSLLDRCRQGPVELEEAVHLTRQLCDGLSQAHAANIIHRDIKPANVLMTTDGVPKLTDFGLAKDDAADTGMTISGAVLGTLDFMPPEQRQDATLTDSRSDLWSLAATLYQLVTGETPRVIDLDLVPQKLRTALSKALKTRKEDRYQTAMALSDALELSIQDGSKRFIQQSDLGAGECPKCHVQNESSRKFCRECAASLRVACLQCGGDMPVWDKVCGECGGKQRELLELRLDELRQKREQAEELRRKYDYEAALQIITELASIDDERFVEHKRWADEFGDAARREWMREQESANQLFSEARKHREAFDYAAAIHAIESIPAFSRTSQINDYLAALAADRDESLSLVKTIRERIAERKLDDLLPKVERAMELQGNLADLGKLKNELVERQAKKIQQIFSKVKLLVDEGQVKAAAALIDQVRHLPLMPTQEKLRDQVEQIVASESELLNAVNEAKAYGEIGPCELVQLLPMTEKYLTLNPAHAQVQKLRADLVKRLSKLTCEQWAEVPDEILTQLEAELLAASPKKEVSGLLELHVNGCGFLRIFDHGYSRVRDGFFIRSSTIEQFGLRQGLCVRAVVQGPVVSEILEVDGIKPEAYPDVKSFDLLTPTNPERMLSLELGTKQITNRVIDLLSPVGKGQKALIVGPPQTGKSVILQNIIKGIQHNYPDFKLMVLLVDERPEETVDMEQIVQSGEVIALNSGMDIESHLSLIPLVIDRAKRLAESGQDVLLVLDSLTGLARACDKRGGQSNSGGAGVNGGADVQTMDLLRKLFQAGGAFAEGGSLTVVCSAMVDTNSRLDDEIIQEFKGAGDMGLVLDRRLVERRVWPSIDLSQSGTRQEELLYDAKTYQTILVLRRTLSNMHPCDAMEQLTKQLERFPSNAEFIDLISGAYHSS